MTDKGWWGQTSETATMPKPISVSVLRQNQIHIAVRPPADTPGQYTEHQ